MNKIFILFTLVNLFSCASPNQICQQNWQITGFYTPLEYDFKRHKMHQIWLNKKSYDYPLEFVKEVQMEGWGKTNAGWYIGYYANTWHKSEQPLNAKGLPLELGNIAVDNSVIVRNSQVYIATLKPHMGLDTFSAVDVGSAIKRDHIDIYTGEGKQAKLKTYQVTGRHNICVNSHLPAPVENLSI
jgi:3D (Asp-Asp-Asp) domain-containing protein